MIKLILADDHPVFVSGLRAVFDAEDDMTVMSVATTGREAVRVAIEHQPDVAVLDLNMPDGDGLWVCGQIRTAGLATRALILTMYDDDENVLAALRAGAYGYTLKGSGPDEIVAAVRAVARGEALFGAGIAAQMLSHFSRTAATSPFPQLTEREHEVLGLLAAGRDNAAVARRLGVTSKTVRNPRLEHHHQAARIRPVGSDHPSPRRWHGWTRRLKLIGELPTPLTPRS